METPSIHDVSVTNITRLKLVKSLKDEAVEGLRVLRYILWFGLHCNVLHVDGVDHINGISFMYLSIPANADHLTFHCDTSFLKILKVYLQVAECEDPSNEKEFPLEEKKIEPSIADSWEVPESDIVYGCGPDNTTCLLHLPYLSCLDTRSKGTVLARDPTADWDECSTTESLDNVTAGGMQTLQVSFYFSARLNTGPEGLYLSQDNEDENEEHCTVVLATALEQLFARRVFPCLDIAQCKAPFSIRVVTSPPCPDHRGAAVFSTTRIEERYCATREQQLSLLPFLLPDEVASSACEVIVFEDTVTLPPYSASLFYGVFEVCDSYLPLSNSSRSALLQCAIPVTVDGMSRLRQSSLAHSWARRVFTFLSRQVFYPLQCQVDKLTFIPLRCQRGLGLENHGCITFKEDFFLISDPLKVPILRVIRIYRLICHEICHQWIGNIFTPHEITDIWLKEGFVRFVEFLIVDALLRSVDAQDLLWASFLFEVKAEALIVDAYAFTPTADGGTSTAQSHPVQTETPCVTLASLTRLFDSITYDKTAAVLMMWDVALSVFRRATSSFAEGMTSGEMNELHPKLSHSTFVPALVRTFIESEKEGKYLFAPETIWGNADTQRENSSEFCSTQESDIWENLGISSPSPIISPCNVKTEDLLRPWLIQIGFPWVIWETSEDLGVTAACDNDSWFLAVEQASHTKFVEALWTIPLAFLFEHCDGRSTRFLPFLLSTKSQVFKIRKSSDIASVSIVDGAKGYGFFLLTRGKSLPVMPSGWQSPCWQFSNLCMGGMILNLCGLNGRRGEATIELWTQWRLLEDATRDSLRQNSTVLYLILCRIQQCHKRGNGPDPDLLEEIITKLRSECCYPCEDSGCLEIIHRSWTWLILGGLSWC